MCGRPADLRIMVIVTVIVIVIAGAERMHTGTFCRRWQQQ